MITVRDVNDTIHEVCPRCGDDWAYIGPDIYCTKCPMMAIKTSTTAATYLLSIRFLGENKKYYIHWYNDVSMVSVEGQNTFVSSELPTLPFDINIQKLQTYLIFS